MRHIAFVLAAGILLAGAQTAGAQPVLSPAALPLALDGASLKAVKTASGFLLSGRAYVGDPCHGARFVLGSMRPLRYDLVQFRKPGTIGMMCIMRAQWVAAASLAVASDKTPPSLIVHTRKARYTVTVK